MTDTERIAAFEGVGRRLWPFVRFFGLSGACPEAIEAMNDLGQLIGVETTQHVDAGDLEKEAYNRAIDAVKELYEKQFFRKMLRRESEQFLATLEESLKIK
jgi:hypothetical protein